MAHLTFSPDGLSLLVSDVFGVTRLALGKTVKVKHTAKVTEARGELSLNGDATLALVHGRVHTGAWGNHGLATLGLPGLGLRDKLPGGYQPRALVTTAAGDRALTLEHADVLVVQVIDGASLREERRVALQAKAARTLPTRQVGPQAAGHWSPALHATPDGRFLARGDTHVYAGRVGASDAEDAVWWALPLAVHCSAEVTLAAVGDASWVLVRDPREDVVRGLVVERDGAVRELSFPSLAAPAVDAEALVTQPDSHTVLARAHADGSERRYDVRAHNAHPAAEPEATAYPHGPPPAPTRLPGRLAMRGASRWFVPWHGETVVDLARGVAHPRGLDAAPGPFRRLLLERYAQLNESLRALGVEATLLAFERHPKEPRVTLASWFPPLPASLAGHVAQAYGQCLWERFTLQTHGHHWASFGQEGGFLQAYGGAPLAEVREALGWMRDHDVVPTDLAAFVARAYDEGMGIPSDPRPAAFPFDDAGERLFLRAVLATLAANGWPAAAPFEAWAAEPIDLAHVREVIAGRASFTRHRHRDATRMVAKMIARHLGAPGLPLLTALLASAVDAPAAYDDVRTVGEAMTWLVHHHPALRDEALAAVDALLARKASLAQNVAYDLDLTRERVARGARHFWSNA